MNITPATYMLSFLVAAGLTAATRWLHPATFPPLMPTIFVSLALLFGVLHFIQAPSK